MSGQLTTVFVKEPLAFPVSSKKHFIANTQVCISITFETMIKSFESLETFMANVPNTETAMKMIPLNTDGFKWNEEDRYNAKTLWNN